MKLYFIKTIFFYVFLSTTVQVYSQDTLRIRKGVVVDSLTVPSIEESHFSVYLPKSIDLNKSWPILFGFDSKANTKDITTLFSKAAEELGYIIVVTNFPKNTSINKKSNYVASFVDYIFTLFPIQKRRVYIVGIGNDAPLNSLLPLVYKEFNGVIAVGNSYSYNQSSRIRRDFSYIGMVGYKNFRYQNFLNTKRFLKRKAITADVYQYQGNEEYPSEDIMLKALTSFRLQDMLKGKIPTDSAWVKSSYAKDLNEVKLLKQQNKQLQAYDELSRMRNVYRLFFDVDELKEEQKKIRKIGAYKKEKRRRSKYHNQELFLRQIFTMSLEEDIAISQYDNLGWWQYKISALDTLAGTQEKYARDMVFRIKGFLKNTVLEYKKNEAKKERALDNKLFLNILSTIIDRKDFESYRNVIALSAVDQDTQTALFYLEKMLQNGYKDKEALYTIEGTLALRISKEYNRIIKKYLGTSKYFTFD